MDKIEKALRDLVEQNQQQNLRTESDGCQALDQAQELLWQIDRDRATRKPGELSDNGRAILTAMLACTRHIDSHTPPCGACSMNLGVLFDAFAEWLCVTEGRNINRAKLEEVFGGNKEQGQGQKTEGGKENKGSEPESQSQGVEEDDWQKGFE